MSSEAKSHSDYIERIVHNTLDGSVERLIDLSPGYSGSKVYAVDVVAPAGDRPCIVKLNPDWGNPEEWPNDERIINRVYGGWPGSFETAYALLRQQGIPLPKLYAALAPQPGFPYYCNIMERLPGEAAGTVRARLSGSALVSFDRVIGRHLGAIHQISRPYYGWADQPAPYASSWRDTFFNAMDIVLERTCAHPAIAERRQQIAQVVGQYADVWREPSRFVLSHHDGFQGMIVPTGSDWRVTGVIDIEDYCFADPRIILAVYELYLIDFQTGSVQESLADPFWKAYQQHSAVERTYSQFRPLFQLYVLLDTLKDLPVTEQNAIHILTPRIDLCCAATPY